MTQPTIPRSATVSTLPAAAPDAGPAIAGGHLSRYALLRVGHLILLLGTALVLARILNVSTYADYARGAFYATAISTFGLFGQDQLLLRRGIALRVLQRRTAALEGALVAGMTILALVLVPTAAAVVSMSCLGTAALCMTGCSWVDRQAVGKDVQRAMLQLASGFSTQAAGVVVAALGGGALAVTTAATAMALLWLGWSLTVRPAFTVIEQVRYRSGLPLGIVGLLYGSVGVSLAFVAAQLPDAKAVDVRFVLLGTPLSSL